MILEDIADIHEVKTWQDLKKWIEDTGTQLEDLTGTDGFDTIDGRLFKSGESGRIWKLKGKEAVLKLTTDPEEIALAKKIEGKNLKSFVNIYKSINVTGIGKQGEKIPAQIRIQELCFPIKWTGLSKITEEEIFEYVQKFIDQALEGNIPNIDTEFAKEFIRAAGVASGYGKFSIQALVDRLTQTELQIIIKVLNFGIQLLEDVKTLTGETDLTGVDLHDDNVMQNSKGEWKMIDF